MPVQLNIKELYDSSKKKELAKFETFDKIVLRAHNRIKLYADNNKLACLYNIPNIIIGYPLFDRDELQNYLISSLKKNGLIIKEYPNYWIYISWDFNKVPKKQKKITNDKYKYVEDYNPTGNFVTNEKALNNIKEKSIQLLNF